MHRFKALASATVLGLAASALTAFSGVSPVAAAKTAVKIPATAAKTGVATAVRHTTLRHLTGVGGTPNTSVEDSKTQPEPGGATSKHAALKKVTQTAAQTAVTTGAPAASYQGINHWGQAVGSRHTVDCSTVGGGYPGTDTCTATNYSFEPPDQMMCSGGSGGGTTTPNVLEGVNDAVATYSTAGAALAGPMTINDLIGLNPEEVLITNTSTGSLVARYAGTDVPTDPRCVYDSSTHRYYMTILDLNTTPGVVGVDAGAGGYTGSDQVYLGISSVDDPTTWLFYSFDVTYSSAPECANPGGAPTACLGDQPLLGFNADGVYITTNEYPFFGGTGRGFFYNGAQMYVFDKNEMGAGAWHFVHYDLGTQSPNYTQANEGPCPYTDPTFGQVCLFYSVQPATTAPGITEPGGSQYFLSNGDFWGFQTASNALSGDNQVFTWQLAGTDAYNASCATTCNSLDLALGYDQVTTDFEYALPPSEACPPDTYYNPFGFNFCARQAPARVQYLPLAQQCWKVGGPAPCPEAGLATNDQRMNQVAMDANGNLWGGFNTLFTTTTSTSTYSTAGIGWVEINPLNTVGVAVTLHGSSLVHDGMTGSRNYDVMFPSLTVGPNGHAVIGMDASGPTIFPAVAYQVLGDGSAPGGVMLSYVAPRPEDGFAAYQAGYQRPRWGDYSSAVVGLNGSIWMAGEVTSLQRTTLANWSTQITSIAAP